MKRNRKGIGCARKIVERQTPLCVCERERDREEWAGASGLEPNASSARSCPHGVRD